MRILTTAALSLILALGLVATAMANKNNVYRWTDAQGRVHYSDKPPANGDFDRVNVRAGPTAQDSEAEAGTDTATTATNTADTKAADNAAAEAARNAENEAIRAERCKTAQRNLAALRSDLEVEADFDGERRSLTAAERQAQIERNQQSVELNCK